MDVLAIQYNQMMAWSRSIFVEMLQTAIADERGGAFRNTIDMFRSHGDVILGDDGSFEKLCHDDNYVTFIYHLLDCWVDSASQPSAYPDIQPDEWLDVAESLLDDIENNKVPSHPRWNKLYTLNCELCHRQTRLSDGRFCCERCQRDVEFRRPQPPPIAT